MRATLRRAGPTSRACGNGAPPRGVVVNAYLGMPPRKSGAADGERRQSLSRPGPVLVPGARHGSLYCRNSEEAVIASEVELKLAARPRDLAALTRALEARADGIADGAAKLVSTYFDTADRALARQGVALRVRERDGHFIQGVKCERRDGPAGMVRGEWEDAISRPEPDPQAGESGRFLAPDVAGRLVPLFRTEVERRALELAPAPGTRIEAAIDHGRIASSGNHASEPISEVELELKGGAATSLYDVALDLLAVAPVRLAWASKAERGYRLAEATPAPDDAVHAGPVELAATMSGDEALRRVGLACLDHLLRNEPAVLAGSCEGIHQMRVAVRRLRAVLSAFARLLPRDQRRAASDELRWLANALSPARNLDVFRQALLVPAQRALPDSHGIAVLAAAAERRRGTACARAVRAVRSRRYTALLLRLLRWFDGCGWRVDKRSAKLRGPIGPVAARVLERRRRVAGRRGRGFAHQSPEERHRLRIALKKLRYALELLAALYDGADVEGFGKRLKRLQDDLGDANDLRVAHHIVAELAGDGEEAGEIAAAGAAVLRWHEERLVQRQPKLHARLDALLKAEPFWRD